jgi:transposase
MSNKAVARTMHIHKDTVKELDKIYMQGLLKKHPPTIPRVMGVDEMSIGKGNSYRIIVSDIERGRPIWIGGEGRKKEDLDGFFQALGENKSKRIKLAVMDMWKAFRNSVEHNAPNAQILYDKFHILNHLSTAMDKVRRSEYKRVSEKDRSFIKGQRYNLLSRRANLSTDSKQALKKLLAANKRLNTAYLLKEEFSQLWDYQSETWARRFFENWKEKLKWQRLKPFEKFAAMIEKHWDGIASYFIAENKVKLGFVEGLNNKVRVIRSRAYGYRDEEYLKLKILTAFFPKK